MPGTKIASGPRALMRTNTVDFRKVDLWSALRKATTTHCGVLPLRSELINLVDKVYIVTRSCFYVIGFLAGLAHPFLVFNHLVLFSTIKMVKSHA